MKYSLLDTNAINAILKDNDFGRAIAERASKEEWVFVLHTTVDAELAQLVERKTTGIALRDFYECFLPGSRFGVAKTLSEIRSEEKAGSPTPIQPCNDIHEGLVQMKQPELQRLLDETHQFSNQIQTLVTEISDKSSPKIGRI